ncbi:MAG: DUF58 domain-containing protein, partial [Byssovorax sp.]
MIPARALVLLALLPLGLAIASLVDRTLLYPMLAGDLGIALIVGFDALLARRPLITVRRHGPGVFSIGKPNVVTLEVRSLARRRLAVSVTDDLFATAESADLPLQLELPGGGRETVRYRVIPSRRGAHV